jgi:hypothetical protein
VTHRGAVKSIAIKLVIRRARKAVSEMNSAMWLALAGWHLMEIAMLVWIVRLLKRKAGD